MIDSSPVAVLAVATFLTSLEKRTSAVETIRPVIGVSNRVVEVAVGGVPNRTESNCRASEPTVPLAIYIASVVDIDEPGVVRKHSSSSKNLQAADLAYKSISVPDIDSSYLTDSSIMVVVNRDVLDLDHCAVIVVLNVGVVVKT